MFAKVELRTTACGSVLYFLGCAMIIGTCLWSSLDPDTPRHVLRYPEYAEAGMPCAYTGLCIMLGAVLPGWWRQRRHLPA